MQVFAMKAEPTARRQVLRDIESFLVRRMVCQLNTRGYNRLFIELLKHLDGPVQDAPSRIRAFLLSSQADSSRWPDDEEFGRKWKSTPLYSVLLQKRVRVLLETIELELYSKLTEKVEIKERLTIEHVMPQKWREHWPLVTEEDTEQRSRHRDTVVHSIGNLTLVNGSLNPTLSNDAWKTKRESMRQFSALALNRQLLEFQDWGEAEIASRADALLEVAKRVWSRPDAARANPIAST
jgi:hypothetical protein